MVDPGDADVRYAFAGNRRLVRARGGGDLPSEADGSSQGIDLVPVSVARTVPAHGGVVLQR